MKNLITYLIGRGYPYCDVAYEISEASDKNPDHYNLEVTTDQGAVLYENLEKC